MRLQFLGANRQVTGSCYVLDVAGLRIMIDCGLFQERRFQARNWAESPVPASSIDYLLLTHAHLDHCGLIPRLVSQGFDRPIITVEPSVRLAEIIMLDAGRIQEEDASYKKRRHAKKKQQGRYPEIPLYTEDDAKQALSLLQAVRYGEPVSLNDEVTATFHEAGHILGSTIVELVVRSNGESKSIVFSGDLGQWNKPLIRDPTLLDRAEVVVMESTYGDRNHTDGGDVESQLMKIINDTTQRRGNVVIPTFAVERAQELMYHIGELVRSDRIPDLPIYLDSPMAVDVTEVFRQSRSYLDDRSARLFSEGQAPLRFPGLRLVRRVDESKAINHAPGSKIIMAASGMCTGGRIKHHLRHNIVRPESTILFVGYQATGTLGRRILERQKGVRIHGQRYPVRAKIEKINGLSAHADRDDLVRWIGHFESPPRRLFLTHGEKKAALALSQRIQDQLGLNVNVPSYGQRVTLG